MTAQDRWLTEHEASDYTGVPVHTLRQWRKPGHVRIRFYRHGGNPQGRGARVRYLRSDLDAYLQSAEVTA